LAPATTSTTSSALAAARTTDLSLLSKPGSGGASGLTGGHDESDLWRKKQLEIRDLQASSQSLLQKVSSPLIDAPGKSLKGGALSPDLRASGSLSPLSVDSRETAEINTLFPRHMGRGGGLLTTGASLLEKADSAADLLNGRGSLFSGMSSLTGPGDVGLAGTLAVTNGSLFSGIPSLIRADDVGLTGSSMSGLAGRGPTLLEQADSAPDHLKGCNDEKVELQDHEVQPMDQELVAELKSTQKDRLSLQASFEQLQASSAEERKRVKREAAKRCADLQARGQELAEEVEEANAKAKEAERTMHSKLAASRQDRQRVEGKLRNQIQALQNECSSERNAMAEAQSLLAHSGDESQELIQLRSKCKTLEEECSALSRRCDQTHRANEALQHQAKHAGDEARQALEGELHRERDRAHGEAWERLSVVEERHTVQLSEIQKAHDREIKIVADQIKEVHVELERRLQAEEACAADRNEELIRDLRSERRKSERCQDEISSVRASLYEASEELASSRAEAESTAQQHSGLLAALRREREIADSQFQQLLRQTEEKQRVLGKLQGEAHTWGGVDLLGGGADTARSPTSPTEASRLLAKAQPLADASRILSMAQADETPRPLGSLGSPPRSPPRSPAGRSSFSVGAPPREDDGVEAVLRSVAFEREVHEVRSACEELKGLTRHLSEEWQGAARQHLDHVLTGYDSLAKNLTEEHLRLAVGRDREASLRENFSRSEARAHRRHEEAMHRSTLQGQVRAQELEVEALQLEATLEGCQGQLNLEFDAMRQELSSEFASEFDELRGEFSCEVVEWHGKIMELHGELGNSRQRCDLLHQGEAAAATQAAWGADLLSEVTEVRAEARAEVVKEELHSSASLAALEMGAAASCDRLAYEDAEDRARVRSEVAELSRTLHAELASTRDEQDVVMRRESRLEARADHARRDCNEAETELRLVKKELQHDMAARLQELREHEMLALAAQRRSECAESHITAAQADREMLERELVQFQNEKMLLEERLEARMGNDADGRRTDSRKISRRYEAYEQEERDVANQLEHRAELCMEEVHERKRSELQLKDQLRTVREDKMKERTRLEKQIDRLKTRLQESEQEVVAMDKRRESESRDLRKQVGENMQHLERARNDNRRLASTLQEAHQERELVVPGFEKTEQALIVYESECQELVTEMHAAEHSLVMLQADRQVVEAARHAEAHKVQDLQREHDTVRRQSAEAKETKSVAERLIKAVEAELHQLLPVLPSSAAQDLTGDFMQTFQSIARWIADTARENAELRSHGMAQPASKQLSLLQKQLVKLREENQELRLDIKKLRVPSTTASTGPTKPQCVNPSGSAASGATATDDKAVSVVNGGGSQALAMVGAPSNVDHRQRIRQLHAEKTKAETEIITLRQDMARRGSQLQSEIERLQSSLWEQQQKSESDQDAAIRRTAHLERRAKVLEEKLRDRTESERVIAAEKQAVEEQLSIAARQLEALLADEHKDGDLQRDLAGLSRQFELLNGKHRAQLSKANEQGLALERECEYRRVLEERLREASIRADGTLTEMAARHDAQMTAMQETVQAMRKRGNSKDRELQSALAEQATLTCEASALKDLQQQQALTSQELQDEIKRLREELELRHEQLREAREKGPSARNALERLRRKEEELEAAQRGLEVADIERRRAQAEACVGSSEIQELRRDSQELRQELWSVRKAEKSANANRSAHSQSWVPTSCDRGAFAEVGGGTWGQQQSSSSRPPEIPDPYLEMGRASEQYEEPECVVVTAQDGDLDDHSSSHRSPQRIPSSPSQMGPWDEPGQAGIFHALEEIQDKLELRERELQEQKEALAKDGKGQDRVPSGGDGRRGGDGNGANDSPGKVACSDVRGTTSGSRELGKEVNLPSSSLAEVPPDFGEYARSIGYRGDVGPLWAEAQAVALGGSKALDSVTSPPRERPIAADVRLRSPATMDLPPSVCGAVAATAPGGYPSSPPNVDNQCYPHSPGRGEDWLSTIGAQAAHVASRSERGDAQQAAPVSPPDPHEEPLPEGATAATAESLSGLPAKARDTFRQAEALCERQQFSEAIPLFQGVLRILEESGREASVPRVVVAEVWAHLGVAMQSLDRVPDAIESYKYAVRFDDTLHVCFANLATLHAYLHERTSALEYIGKALVLDPLNPTYGQIRRHLEDVPPAARGAEAKTCITENDPAAATITDSLAEDGVQLAV